MAIASVTIRGAAAAHGGSVYGSVATSPGGQAALARGIAPSVANAVTVGGSASVAGGRPMASGAAHALVAAGPVTMLGGGAASRFLTGVSAFNASVKGGSSVGQFAAAAGRSSVQAGHGTNMAEFFKVQTSHVGSAVSHVLAGANSVASGSLHAESHSLSQWANSANKIQASGGHSVITMADKTTINLVGVSHLKGIE